MENKKDLDVSAFAELPDEARLWIHGSRDPLDQAQISKIDARLTAFFPGWTSHGRGVQAAHMIHLDRFVLTAAHASGGISGCSTDALIREFKELRTDGIDLLDGGLVFYRDRSGQVQAVEHLFFYEVVGSGEIGADTPVFDTLMSSLGVLRGQHLEKPFAHSWHALTYAS